MNRVLALLVGWSMGCGAMAADEESQGFTALLHEAELVFSVPDGYLDLPPGRTPMLDYERALRSPQGNLEMRVAVRPLERLRIDYDDPHGAVPDPNHIFPLVFESLASRLAGGRHAPSNPYPPEQARERFNADWAAAAVFDTSADFDTRYRQGLLLAIHRNKVSDAYVVFLFDDYTAVRDDLKALLRTLVYAPKTSADGDRAGAT